MFSRFGFYYLFLSIFTSILWLYKSLSVVAAEKISLRYGLLEFSLPVSSLENYVKTGQSDRYIDVYLQYQ